MPRPPAPPAPPIKKGTDAKAIRNHLVIKYVRGEHHAIDLAPPCNRTVIEHGGKGEAHMSDL